MMKKAKKRNRQPHPNNRHKDTHHILWPRYDWNKGWAKALRCHWYLKVEIPKYALHQQIHREVRHVPVPSAVNTKAAIFQLSELEKYGAIHPSDTIERRLLVLMAIFECCEPKTYAAIRAQYDLARKFYYKNPH